VNENAAKIIKVQEILGRTHKGRTINNQLRAEIAAAQPEEEAIECAVCGFVYWSSFSDRCMNCNGTDTKSL